MLLTGCILLMGSIVRVDGESVGLCGCILHKTLWCILFVHSLICWVKGIALFHLAIEGLVLDTIVVGEAIWCLVSHMWETLDSNCSKASRPGLPSAWSGSKLKKRFFLVKLWKCIGTQHRSHIINTFLLVNYVFSML